MSNFWQGFGFGLTTSMFGGFSSFGFGGFGLGSFGNSVFRNPISTCYADLDSRAGMSSWVPGLNSILNQGYTFPITCSIWG